MQVGEADSVLVHRTNQEMQNMLSDRNWIMPASRSEVRARTYKLEETMRQLDIQRRRDTSSELLGAIARAKAEYALLKWRLFPINNLPVEILHRIFVMAVSSPSIAEMSKTRVILASVCSYWRWIAVNLAKLWAIIQVTPSKSSVALLHLCLQRTKEHGLMLFVDMRDRTWDGSEMASCVNPAAMRALMNLIVSFFDRVLQLAIFADTWAVLLPVKEVLQSARPPRELNRLEIHRTGNAYVDFPPGTIIPRSISTPCFLFGGASAPELQQVIFEGFNIDFARSSFRNLRVLEIRKLAVEQMPPLEQFLPVLQASPGLERLVFDGASPLISSIRADWQPVPLYRLRELIIVNLVPEYAIYLVQLISAPNLKRLVLEKLHGGDFTTFIQSLIGRFPKIVMLTVNWLVTNNSHTLAAWLRTSPAVRYMRIGFVAKEFFDALLVRAPIYPDQHPKEKPVYRLVCPDLEVCEVLSWATLDFDDFKRFCVGRRETLRSIFVSETGLRTLDPGDRAWLVSTGIMRQIPPDARPDLNARYA